MLTGWKKRIYRKLTATNELCDMAARKTDDPSLASFFDGAAEAIDLVQRWILAEQYKENKQTLPEGIIEMLKTTKNQLLEALEYIVAKEEGGGDEKTSE